VREEGEKVTNLRKEKGTITSKKKGGERKNYVLEGRRLKE